MPPLTTTDAPGTSTSAAHTQASGQRLGGGDAHPRITRESDHSGRFSPHDRSGRLGQDRQRFGGGGLAESEGDAATPRDPKMRHP